MDVRHNLVQTLVYLLTAPGETHRVLRHLQTRGGHTTGVHSLTRGEQLMSRDELLCSFCCATHVRHLCYAQRFVGQDTVCILTVQLVLGGTRQVDVGLLLPRLLAGIECGAVKLLLVWLTDVVTRGAQLKHILDLLSIETGGVVDVTVRAADGDHLRTQFGSFLCSTPCHVAEARECNGLALDVETVLRQHLVHEVECAVARSLWTEDRAAPFHAFAREHALELVRQLLVLSVEVTDLPGTHADITGRHILVGTDMAVQLCHECLAELHHLIVTLTADREVGTALTTAHRQRSECVLERLLETEELQDRQVYRRVEAQTALVGADGAIKLHAVAQVHLHLALIVDPGHTERDDPLGLHDTLDNLGLLELGMLVVDVLNRLQHLSYCL